MNFKPANLLVLSLSLLTALTCSTKESESLKIPPGAPAGYLDMKPDIYVVEEREYRAEKGLLVVPENRDDPKARVIAIPIIRVFAIGDSVQQPIFFLNGGPGISNMRFQQLDGLVDRHDVVMVGYRGVDGSVVLDCPEFDTFLSNLPEDITAQGSIDRLAEAYTRCASRLQAEGIDTDGYTILEVVQDVEAARQALGYEQINLISQSYGTRLAMIYAWMYPTRVARSAMISVNPPGRFVWFPEVIDEQLRYYADLCRKDEECRSHTDDLAELIRSAMQDMPDQWLFFPIKRGNVLMGTFMMLYHTESARDVFDAWVAASDGDWSGIAMLSMAIDFLVEGASVWGESAAKAVSADYDFEPGRNILSDFMPPGSIIGAPGSVLGIAAAQGWPAKRIPDSLRFARPSDVRTLLISGSIDFSTPARFARDELLPLLSNGDQVILSEFGHTGEIWWKQPEATRHLLKTFFDEGLVDHTHFVYSPMDFHVGLGYPGIMKLALAGMILLPSLLGLLTWYVIRRIRRRRALQMASSR